MKKMFLGLGLFVAILSFTSSAALAFSELGRTNRILAGTSSGFSVIGSEASFLTDVSGDYFIDENFSIGGQLLLGVSDIFYWAPQVVGKYNFNLSTSEEMLNHLHPYLEIPMGFVVTDNSDVGFLAGFGFGGDYFMNSRWALGTNMLFQFSNELGGENFGFFWKVITVKYLF